MALPATLQSRGAGSRARRWAGTQLSILLKCICVTAFSHSTRHSCFLGHPVALAVSVCVCMHMKRFQVLKMEISVLNFKWFTDKLKQMERKKKESKGDQMYTFQGLLLLPCPGVPTLQPSFILSSACTSVASSRAPFRIGDA